MSRQTELMAISDSAGQKKYIFFLECANIEPTPVQLRYAPDGWDSSKFSIVRNKKWHGLFRKVAVDELTFVKDGRDFLQDAYNTAGITAEIVFTVKKLNTTTYTYDNYYIGKPDLSTYKITETGVEIQIIDQSFTEKIKNRERQKVNIRQTTSIEGFEITPFADENPELHFNLFKIYGNADWRVNYLTNGAWSYEGWETNISPHYLPMLKGVSDFADAQTQYIDALIKCFDGNDADRTVTVSGQIKGDLSSHGGSTVMEIWIYLKYASTTITLYHGSDTTDKIEFDFDFSEEITLAIGDDVWLTCTWFAVPDTGTPTVSYDVVNVNLAGVETTLDPDDYIAYPFYEALLRITQIIGDKYDVLQSIKFGRTDTPIVQYGSDGELGHITRGAFLRKATAKNNTIAISLEDIFRTLNNVFNLGMGIETVGGVNKLVVEDISHFYDSEVVLDLSARIVENEIEKEVIPDKHYNSIKTGYTAFLYEFLNGLNEFNTKSEFSTVINVLENVYDLVSRYRADTNGIVLLRQEEGTNEDVKGDDDIFIIDAVRKGAEFAARTNDGFDIPATGTPEEYQHNINWTPARNLLRHGDHIRAGLEKSLTSYLRWQFTEKNSTFITQLTGADLIRESDDIKVSNLDTPFYWSEQYNIECPFYQADLELLEAKPQGLIKLSDTKYGWILSVDVHNESNKAELKLLRCNLDYITPS